MKRTYGQVDFEAETRRFVITCEPHVALKLKRVFAKLWSGSLGEHRLSDTPENAFDLRWFLTRYPLKVSKRAAPHLEKLAGEYAEQQSVTEALLAGRLKPDPVPLAKPLREYQAIAVAMARKMRGLLLCDEMGLGKMSSVNEPILTPSGWRPMGSLRVGDAVIGSAGRPVRVMGVFPQGRKPLWRVTMTDGAWTRAGAEHLWAVETANDRFRRRGLAKRWRVMTTAQIEERGITDSHGNSKWFVPIVQAVQFRTQTLVVPPYLLGALLANGNFAETPRHSGSAEQRELMRPYLPTGCRYGTAADDNRHDVRIVGAWAGRPNPLTEALRSLSYVLSDDGSRATRSHNKFIPPQYLLGDVEQRQDLLCGLMDNDGTVHADGMCLEYNTVSPQLAEDVLALVRSLGGSAWMSTRIPTYTYKGERLDGQRDHRIRMAIDFCPFRVAHKRERVVARTKYPPTHAIAQITPDGEDECVCIAVDAPDHLYVTRDYILTHNTASAIGLFVRPECRPCLVVTMTALTIQWQREITLFAPQLRTHILQSTTPYALGLGDACVPPNGQQTLPGATPDVILSSYHKLTHWAETLGPILRTVVFDEAQELRLPGSKKYEAAKHLASGVDYRLGLTGTPVYNQGSEFHSVAEVITPDKLGSRKEFLREWCGEEDRNDRSQRIRDPKAFGEHVREMGVMLRRTRKDVGRELPALTRVPFHIDADLEALDKVSAACRELALFLVGRGPKPVALHVDERRGAHMAASEELSNKLRQATGIAKAPHVAALVKMIVEQEKKVVLFGWHREVYRIWQELFEKPPFVDSVLYTGSESVKQKDEARAAFVEGSAQVLIMSLRSGAGLDGLQKASSTPVFGELDWAYGVHDQCECRVNRDGQEEPVFAYYPVCDIGSDPSMMDTLGIKRMQLDGILDPKGLDFGRLQSDPNKIKNLAEAYLSQQGEHT